MANKYYDGSEKKSGNNPKTSKKTVAKKIIEVTGSALSILSTFFVVRGYKNMGKNKGGFI